MTNKNFIALLIFVVVMTILAFLHEETMYSKKQNSERRLDLYMECKTRLANFHVAADDCAEILKDTFYANDKNS